MTTEEKIETTILVIFGLSASFLLVSIGILIMKVAFWA